jgi:hypothetical protein
MHFTFVDDGIDAVVIDNFYTEPQLSDIWKELGSLTNEKTLSSEQDLISAEVDGSIQTVKSGVFLESFYKNIDESSFIRHFSSNIWSNEVAETLIKKNPLYKCLYSCNSLSYLLSYYENGGYYKRHIDSSFFTVLNYFHKEPKKFSGGEIILHSAHGKIATIEPTNNRIVLIASCTPHEVATVNSSSEKYSGDGRYCISSFISYRDQRENKL